MNIQEHSAQLAWFEQKAGETVPWPGQDAEGMLLVTKAKGIYKPAGSRLPVSIRIAQDGPYADRPEFFADGSWTIRYHEERPSGQSEPAGNTALRSAMEIGHPVGVIQQVSQSPRLYKVLGLGLITTYAHGLFVVEGPVSSADTPGASPLTYAREAPLASAADMRQRILAEVVRRQGQGKFRQSLMTAYAGRCAMTGCAIAQVLEAAHILPYKGLHSHSVPNGLLLRADMHTLFDLGLAWICPETWTVRIKDELSSAYGAFDGKKAHLPTAVADWPDPVRVRQRMALFETTQS